jgi:hypothetical protein
VAHGVGIESQHRGVVYKGGDRGPGSHEKLVKVSVAKRTYFVGGEVELFNRITPIVFTRVLFGLNRPIGESLIRALRHIIEFDSGLLIRHLDLRLTPGS